jgi:hypothetical protein
MCQRVNALLALSESTSQAGVSSASATASASSADRVTVPAATDLVWLSLEELAPLIRERRVSAVEVARGCLARIERLEPRLRAFITITADRAIADARAVDDAVASGQLPALSGVPIALKDLYETAGVRTTAGSKILADYVPDFHATVVERLHRQGIRTVHPRGLFDRAWVLATELGRSNTYDAIYVAAAELRKCELWTADYRLANAARRRLG